LRITLVAALGGIATMPFGMKLWQVQAKDLQEIKRDALNDEQRLED